MTHLLIGWRAGDLIVIMDGGQHGPPRREVWSYHHPSSKQSSPIHHDNFEPSLLTRLSRLFQRREVIIVTAVGRWPTARVLAKPRDGWRLRAGTAGERRLSSIHPSFLRPQDATLALASRRQAWMRLIAFSAHVSASSGCACFCTISAARLPGHCGRSPKCSTA